MIYVNVKTLKGLEMLKSAFRKRISKLNTEDQKWMMIMEYPIFSASMLSVFAFVLMVVIPVGIVFDYLIVFFELDFLIAFSIMLPIEIIFILLSFKFGAKIPIISKLYSLLYFNIYTRKGKAITRKQFKKIREEYLELYKLISLQKVASSCYSVSFELLKLLREGAIIFLAIDDIDTSVHKNTDFHMHTLYLNNGYVFDTDSSLQIPYDEYLSISKAKIFKIFSFDDIKDFDFMEFRDMFHSQLVDWCKTNQIFLWSTCPVVE